MFRVWGLGLFCSGSVFRGFTVFGRDTLLKGIRSIHVYIYIYIRRERERERERL